MRVSHTLCCSFPAFHCPGLRKTLAAGKWDLLGALLDHAEAGSSGSTTPSGAAAMPSLGELWAGGFDVAKTGVAEEGRCVVTAFVRVSFVLRVLCR